MASRFSKNSGALSQDDTILQEASGQLEAQRASALSEKPELAGYELNYLLGRGSFGEVWAGSQRSTGQSVAVKFFLAGDLSYMRRELDRLREVSQHFAVVGLLDADLNHQPPYFVMPLLVSSLAEAEAPSPAQAARWMGQLASGLRHSHEKGLLHCDLKPSNAMLDESGAARLVDFGQSRQQDDGVVAWGTLGYMAPEQASLGNESQHSSPSVAWDVYGLGATIYRLLTGFCPYWSEAELKDLNSLPLATRLRRYRQQIQISPLIPLRKVNPKVDADLADLVQACLACDPGRRPSSVGAILEDLERRRQGYPLLCRRPWGWGYLLSKWARHPALVAASLATAALIGTVSYSYARMRQANLEQQQLIGAMVVQQAGQAQPEESQLWRCRALENNPQDPVLRTQLAREHFGLQAYSAISGSWQALPGRPELIQWTDSEVFLWKGGQARPLKLPVKPLKVITSPSRAAIFGSERGLVYDLETGRVTDLNLGQITQDAAWAGDTLVVLNAKGVSRWSVSGKPLGALERQGDWLSPDGRWLYGTGQLTEIASGKTRHLPEVETGEEEELFSPGGSWLRQRDRLIGLKGQADWILPSKFACFVDDQRVAVLDGSRLSVISRQGPAVELQGAVEGLEVRAGGDFLLVAGAGDEFSLWDSRNGALLTSKRLPKVGRHLRQLVFNGDASLLVGDDTSTSKIWRLDPPRPLWSANTPGQVLEIAWGEAQDWLWAGAEDGLVRLSAQGRQLEEFRWTQPARSYAFSPQGLGLVELEGGLRVFWPGHQESLAEYAPGQFEEKCRRVFFSADGSTALASLPGLIKVWQVGGQQLQPLREVAIADPPQQLAFSSGGHYLAALCGKLGDPKLKLGVWRLPELRGVPLDISEIAFEGQPLQLAFDPSEQWLLVGSAGRKVTLSLRDRSQISHWQASLDPDAPWMLGPGWILESDSNHALQKVSLPAGQALGASWPQPLQVSALEQLGDLGIISNLYDTSLLDLRNGQPLPPRLGVGGFSHLLQGRPGLLGSLENQVGLWPLGQATASPEALTRRWESLTGKRLDRQRATVVELTPQQWTPP